MEMISPAMGHEVDPEALALLGKKCLEEEGSENTRNYKYVVSKNWMENWKKYTGQVKPFTPGAVKVPGPVEENLKDLAANELVDGRLWRHLIYWYGLHPTHELVRYKDKDYDWPCLTEFSIGVMSPLADLVKRETKKLALSDCVGYMECQLRHMLGVPPHRQTRMWVRKEGDASGYQLLCDRYRESGHAIEALGVDLCDDDKKTLLSLEIRNPQGDWPTGYVTEVVGKLQIYTDVTVGGQTYGTQWDSMLCENTGHRVQEMQEWWQGEIAALQKLRKTFDQQQKNLAKELNLVNEEKKKQDARKEKLKMKEKIIQEREGALFLKTEKLKQEEKEYHKELERAQLANTIAENKITLNVGGKYFTTSLHTLTTIPDTYFASMFSGRYPLIKCPDDSYFIDRDGAHFYHILEYLRNGELDLKSLIKDDNTDTLKYVMIEADFYNVAGLCNDIRQELHLDYADLFGAFKDLASCDDLFSDES